LIRKIGQERYKQGRLADIPEGEAISFYHNGEFIDLCAGTHVNYSSKVKAVKLLTVAGAYHRGDEKNKQLQRIYAPPSRARELEQYLTQLEEAKKRDHRTESARTRQLFHIDEAVARV
jgi:threonyl-tRNA synthetase